LTRIVIYFLIAIAILALLGKLNLPSLPKGKGKRGPDKLPKPRKCADCGAPVIGGDPCPCKNWE
jgi:hypothetical protein